MSGMSEDLLSPAPCPVQRSTDPIPQHPLHPAPPTWLRRLAHAGLNLTDALCIGLTPAWAREAPGLIVIAFHSLCRSRAQLHDPAIVSDQNVCVDDLRALVETVLASGYTIVSPQDVADGLPSVGKFAMLTFDDGYFNNVLALDVLDEFQVPAAFFIASGHVLQGKGFWWDAVSRELLRAGISRSARNAELRRLKALSPAGVEAAVRARFGPTVLRPRGDTDRPFTAAELADFARHRWVHIGNHTVDHAILTRCSRDEMQRQIRECQEALQAITGQAPVAIAYPNGNHSATVVAAARAAGLRVGLTVHPAKNRLPAPADSARLMELGRFYFHGRPDPALEFRSYRCGFLPSRLVRTMLQPA
jgi:peptidoglycan/xylan/chitin deacetylase (PgdA/CDA1 family)